MLITKKMGPELIADDKQINTQVCIVTKEQSHSSSTPISSFKIYIQRIFTILLFKFKRKHFWSDDNLLMSKI